ncbi:hypothetical protein Prum_089110 [Phytohabitans rumicis]|uniref:Uncharacterized protein n=2 Tax=Phytohabitans rumicis TaxID=1076125 RepID=A0A6V8LKV2_9ACTN|nr:hypothetical protein Prum_089110 [Phytohabitans rumicis]
MALAGLGPPGESLATLVLNYYYGGVPAGPSIGDHFFWRHTTVLYDAGVTSFAWGHCSAWGVEYSNGTRSY